MRRPELASIWGHELGNFPNLVGRLVPLPVPDWSKPIIVVLVLISLLLGIRAWLNGVRASRLESQHKQLTHDLASIQSALIPEIPARLGALAVSAAYRPADGPGAGGDFYDAFALAGGRVAIILGDVSGHGRTAIGRAAHMHYTLRAYIEMGLEPRAALKLAGRVLGTEENDLFATVLIAVHDPATATLTYATAGHPAPILLDAAAHQPLTTCASPALGWGVPTGRRQTTVPFPAGARACFFTDGVTEARAGEKLLGRQRLSELVAALGAHPAADELLEQVRTRACSVHDDMAACVITAIDGAPAETVRVEELEVDLEQLREGQAARFLKACGVSPDDAAPAVGRACEVAAGHDGALLRVGVHADGGARARVADVASGAPAGVAGAGAAVALPAVPTVAGA